jgi:MFS family permease
MSSSSATSPPPKRYWSLLRNGEFRGLVLAQFTSECGDHVARVALAALVLERLDSALLAALAFVVGYLPAVFGGSLLAPFADRMPRRRLMLTCDLVRAGIVALMTLLAVDSTPIWVLYMLLLFAELFTAPFEAARAATLPDVLTVPRDYLGGVNMTRVLHQANQVIGLTAAGVIVHTATPRWALAADAVTFLDAYLILLTALRPRSAPIQGGERLRGLISDFRDGAQLVFGYPPRRMLVLLAWCAAIFLIAAEGVALVYAREHGVPDIGGALMASVPLGGAVGAWLLGRARPSLQLRLIRPLAVAACIPLLLTGFDPPVLVALVLWFIGGACQGFMVPILATVNLLTPSQFRGRVNGLGAAGFSVANAISFLLVGYLADLFSPATAVALAGLAGLVMLIPIYLAWPTQELRQDVRRAYGPDAEMSSW